MCLGYPSFVIDQETDLLSIASTPVANEYCSSSIIPLQCLHQIYTTLVLYEYSRVVPTNVWSTSISISRYRVYSKYINMLHYIAFFFPNCTRQQAYTSSYPIRYGKQIVTNTPSWYILSSRYPSDVDKHILARQTGLSRSQVRIRLLASSI